MDDQARLESAYLRKGIVGSNPTLSAKSTPAERSGNPAIASDSGHHRTWGGYRG